MDTPQEPLILQNLLQDDSIHWKIHNCKILQQHISQDLPLGFLLHYDSLDEDIKATHPLDQRLLKLMDTPMKIHEAAKALNIDTRHFKNPWYIKYIGSIVIAYEPLLIALRVHFSNTAKPAQAVYLSEPQQAWQQQCHAWRCFGVVDILSKGSQQIVSIADDQLSLLPAPRYQALPSEHSLSLTELINEHKQQLEWLNQAVTEHLFAHAIEIS